MRSRISPSVAILSAFLITLAGMLAAPHVAAGVALTAQVVRSMFGAPVDSAAPSNGDVLTYSSTSGAWGRSAPSVASVTTSGVAYVYTGSGGVLGANTVAGALELESGGTPALGDLFYRDSSGLLQRLGIGAESQLLSVSSGAPKWVTTAYPSAGAFVSLGDDLTITTSTFTTIGFDGTATEVYDTGNLHDPVTNNDRILLDPPGFWWVSFRVQWDGSAAGFRQISLSHDASTSSTKTSLYSFLPSDAVSYGAGTSGVVQAVSGDFITGGVEQNTGGNLNVKGSTTVFQGRTFIAAFRIGD